MALAVVKVVEEPAQVSCGDECKRPWLTLRSASEGNTALQLRGADLPSNGALLAEMHARQQEIARELHDSVASTLAGVSLLLGAAEDVANAACVSLIARAQTYIRQAAEQVRNISHGVLGDVGTAPLSRCLEQLAHDLSSSGLVQCCVRERGDTPELSLSCRTHVYRMAQEAAANAIRHGQATRISICLIHGRSGRSRLVVRDDGRGCDFGAISTGGAGIGLRSMRARASQLAGTLSLQGTLGRGCTVRFTWQARPTGSQSPQGEKVPSHG